MVLNIICSVINVIATILIALVVSIYAAAASAVATKCSLYGTNLCRCYVDGKTYTYTGRKHLLYIIFIAH